MRGYRLAQDWRITHAERKSDLKAAHCLDVLSDVLSEKEEAESAGRGRSCIAADRGDAARIELVAFSCLVAVRAG